MSGHVSWKQLKRALADPEYAEWLRRKRRSKDKQKRVD